MARAGAEIDPKQFYPAVDLRSGTAHDLPMSDNVLRKSLIRHIKNDLQKTQSLSPLTHSSFHKKVGN